MRPDKLKLSVWNDKLTSVMRDMERTYGDTPEGCYPPAVVMAVNLAWRELQAEIRLLEQPRAVL